MTTPPYWRLLDYGFKDPAMNLAVEEAILRSLLEHRSPHSLCLWQNPPSVIIGFSQNPRREVDVAACKKLSVPILRRVSGGGAVYHDYGNLNYSLIVRKSSLKGINDIEQSYDVFCSGVIEALRTLGIVAHHQGGDILIGGKKISGSAQHRLYATILHHGTLMVDVNFEMLGHTLRVSKPERHLVNLRDVLPQKISIEEIKETVKKGFENKLDIKLGKEILTSKEMQVAKNLYEVKYNKRDWHSGPRAQQIQME